MVDLNETTSQQLPVQHTVESDPLGVTGTNRDPAERSFSSNLPPYTPMSSKNRLITVTYCPPNQDQSSPHTALIPWTAKYETALVSAKEAFQRYFPGGSANRHRWLATRVQTSSGVTWAEFLPQVFANIIEDPSVELRLCEGPAPKLDVSVLPIGHEHVTQDSESYYQFKIIAVGQRNVGKSMMLQCFTRAEEDRLDTLSSTVGPSMDITNRFMTAHGELIKTMLWDTAGQEAFRAMIKPLYRGANGVFLVYSVADPESFNQCTSWLEELGRHVDENVPIMLIGNQVDRITERVVQRSDAQAFALEHGLLFAEISSKNGANLDYAFQQLVHEIFNRLKDRNELYRFKETKRSSRAKRLEDPKPSAFGRCCAA